MPNADLGLTLQIQPNFNSMLIAYLQELEEIYIDLCKTLAESILHEADVITTKVRHWFCQF